MGLELGFFDNKLTSEFDYYRKITDGILVDLLTPGHLGNGPYTTVTYNAAEVLNNGFEWNVGWNERRGDLYYKITVLGSTLHNEVLSLGDTNALGGFIPSGAPEGINPPNAFVSPKLNTSLCKVDPSTVIL